MAVVCKVCEKTFSSQSTLNRHLHKVHKEIKKNIVSHDFTTYNNKCLEEGCHTSYKFTSELRYHLENDHKLEMKKELMEFDAKEDFESWLLQVSKEKNVDYLRREMKDNIYYNCNRSGNYQVKGHDRKRALKSQGSCKVGHICTSQIIVVNNGDTYSVTYYSTHYGHDTEVQHVRMPKDDRFNIASKLSEGQTNSKILDSTRNNFHENNLTRTNLLTRNDINNIKYSFKINSSNKVSSQRTSVGDIWNEEFEVDENQQILMHKKEGEEHYQLETEDYCLIFMNYSQQHMLRKFGGNIIAVDHSNGLSSIMVIDEFGEGFPGACMFTNRSDTFIYTLFFETVASHVGIIQPDIFISDEKLSHYVAWQGVMGPVKNQLPLKGHIDRSWQNALSKNLNSDMDKGTAVLLKYIRDKTVERLIKLTKGKNTSQMQAIHSRHRFALASAFAYFSSPDTENTWTLISQTESCEVSRNEDYTSPCCQIKCSYCNVCIHGYTCTCQDFCANSTMCCHIHYVVLKISQNGLEGQQKGVDTLHRSDEVKEHLQTLSSCSKNKNDEDPMEIQISEDISGTEDLVIIDSLDIGSYVIVENKRMKIS